MAIDLLLALQGPFFGPPPSAFVTTMTVATIGVMVKSGIDELSGKKHMQYSKLVSANTSGGVRIPSRAGMLLFYTPAFLCSAASFFLCSPDGDTRFFLLRTALAVHFLKRILEVLFVHKYSRGMAVDAVIAVPSHYFLAALTMIYAQHLSLQLPEPSVDLKYFGVVLFLIGIAGNFYHHYILSTLRGKGDQRDYKIPKGSLFDWVICPHYLFEVLGFLGVTCIAQTLYALSFTISTTAYLMGRSHATKNWYASKFEDFPRHVKRMIPFLF